MQGPHAVHPQRRDVPALSPTCQHPARDHLSGREGVAQGLWKGAHFWPLPPGARAGRRKPARSARIASYLSRLAGRMEAQHGSGAGARPVLREPRLQKTRGGRAAPAGAHLSSLSASCRAWSTGLSSARLRPSAALAMCRASPAPSPNTKRGARLSSRTTVCRHGGATSHALCEVPSPGCCSYLPPWATQPPTSALLRRGAPAGAQVQPHLDPLHRVVRSLAHALHRVGMRCIVGRPAMGPPGAGGVGAAVAGRPLGMAQVAVRLLGWPLLLLQDVTKQLSVAVASSQPCRDPGLPSGLVLGRAQAPLQGPSPPHGHQTGRPPSLRPLLRRQQPSGPPPCPGSLGLRPRRWPR